MSEEIKEEQSKKCECQGKCIKVFLLGILASFIGCLLALCIFSAATKPKFPPPMMMKRPMPMQQFNYDGFYPQKRFPKQFNGHCPYMRQGFDGPNMQRPFDGVKMHDNSGFGHRPDFRGENFPKRFDGAPSPKM